MQMHFLCLLTNLQKAQQSSVVILRNLRLFVCRRFLQMPVHFSFCMINSIFDMNMSQMIRHCTVFCVVCTLNVFFLVYSIVMSGFC